MKVLFNVLTVFVLLFSSGCSQKYSLERKLWLLEKQALDAVADPNQIVDARLEGLVKETDVLLPLAKSRGLGVRARLLKAILLAGLGKDAEAIAIGDEIGEKENKVMFYDGLGKWFLKRKEFKSALRCFDKGLSAVKGSPLYYKGLVDLYLVAKEAGQGARYYSFVKEEYDKAVSSDKPVVRYMGEKGLSRFYLATGDIGRSIDQLDSIAKNKDYPEKLRAKAFIDKVLVLLKDRRIEEAKSALAKAEDYDVPEEVQAKVEKMIDLVEEKSNKQGKPGA